MDKHYFLDINLLNQAITPRRYKTVPTQGKHSTQWQGFKMPAHASTDMHACQKGLGIKEKKTPSALKGCRKKAISHSIKA